MSRFISSKATGFTLTEILVSLSVLGLIVAFAVPKILHATNEASMRTSYKTTVETVQKIVSNGMLNADFNELTDFEVATSTDGLTAYVGRQINGTPCEAGNTTNPNCQMEWGTGAAVPTPVTGTSARWILPSGARLWIPAALGANGLLRFRIDARKEGESTNDATSPELPDLLELTCNLNDGRITFLGLPLKPGECKPSDANNQTIFDAIYTR
jgi:prepilin-type N-terminal cleavage/methylation domain-containing protein